MMTIKQEIEKFAQITDNMKEIYACKHHDYGQSTKDTYRKYGLVSMIVRMRDKLNRIETMYELMQRDEAPLVNESLYDTLGDLANYAIITIIEQMDLEEDLNKSMRQGN